MAATDGQSDEQDSRSPGHPRLAIAIASFGCLGCLVWAATLPTDRLDDPLLLVLTAAAIGANVVAAGLGDRFSVSASFTCTMLALAFLGPTPAFAVVALAEIGTWLVQGARRRALAGIPVTTFGMGAPHLLGGALFLSWGLVDNGSASAFLPALAAIAALTLTLNFGLVSALGSLYSGLPLYKRRPPKQLLLTLALNIGLTLAVAEVYRRIGLLAGAGLILVIVTFTYMARLVVTAQERTRQYAALSWGVLSGLIRTLDLRDSRTARHSAAVAAFARDIAKQCRMSSAEQELAHTAGLLHDIGRFALSDRVMERGTVLADNDWDNIRRHPEIGEDMLKDLGLYGPVAEIVRAHHERMDGRGYPDGLGGEEIPAIARIVAVAEVYDTLTAEDTYRTPLSSFEALNELRRVSGTQLDGYYVEQLADLLSGQGLDYRHADSADFGRELDVERRLNRAATP